jgi:hypothetical protein
MTDGLCWWQGSTETNTSVRAAALGVDRHSIASPRQQRNKKCRYAQCKLLAGVSTLSGSHLHADVSIPLALLSDGDERSAEIQSHRSHY